MTGGVAQDLSGTNWMSEQARANPHPCYFERPSRVPALWNSRHKVGLTLRYVNVSAALRHEASGSDRIDPYVRTRIPSEGMPEFERTIEIPGDGRYSWRRRITHVLAVLRSAPSQMRRQSIDQPANRSNHAHICRR